MTAIPGVNEVFDPVLSELSDRHRDEVLTAYAAVEHCPEPIHEAQVAALRDATLRRSLEELLVRTGRTLVPVEPSHWTSGYRDDVAAELTRDGWNALPIMDRAVLVLVLIHSVAIPRSRGVLSGDAWTSAEPTTAEELRQHTQLPRTEIGPALGRLRSAGLIRLVSQRAGAGQSAAYVPGPQMKRLTASARRRLQDELILAAAPDSPIAAAIRARRADSQGAR